MDKLETLTTPLLQKHAEPAGSGRPSNPVTVEDTNRAAFSRGNLSPAHFSRLWQRMAETFGHKWTSNYGTAPNQSWVDGLADMTVDDIKMGLANLKTWVDEDGWPPTMLQFRELCRPHAAPAHTQYTPLPAPSSSWEQRQHAATSAFESLREGVLKPEIAERDYQLSDEDRANMEKLDWERIHQATHPPATNEPKRPYIKINAPITGSTGCTCRLTFNGDGYVVQKHTCDYCQAWDKKLTESGVSHSPMPAQDKKPRRRKYGKAA